MDLPSDWLILLWPPITVLMWTIIARAFTCLPAARFAGRASRPPGTPAWGRPRSARAQIVLLALASAALTVLAAAAGLVAAGTREPFRKIAWRGSLHLVLTIEMAELIVLVAWGAWRMTGRLLRPVETVCAELRGIDFTDLPARVSTPRNAREIAGVCQSINNLLGRLNDDKRRIEEIARRRRRFVSDVSHELRNPIAGLRTQVEAAQLEPGRHGPVEVAGPLLAQVRRLQMIIEDMLCLARVQSGTPVRQRFDLATLAETVVSERADPLPVLVHVTRGATVSAVPSHMARLLTNLLDNAQRHSIRLVRVEVRARRTVVELVVSDDGRGIPAADRERVFHRFTRLDEARRLDRSGSGLGLAIARDIAHAHHGTLVVEDSPTGGARFVLRLPRVSHQETGSP
ncbi:HAMP domain-containing sensor histidine kinase [Sphaerisporangium sp. B11E5]|uniref:sensor histidine kinase n=1 Tax=Sphaerisporangium sp. B11E5 TaxID=3153563 RepID=UPI00325F90D7